MLLEWLPWVTPLARMCVQGHMRGGHENGGEWGPVRTHSVRAFATYWYQVQFLWKWSSDFHTHTITHIYTK